MKKYSLFLLVLSFVLLSFLGITNSASASNCAPGDLFSSTTGQPCNNTNPTVECLPGYLFSPLTGQPCNGSTFPPGCNSYSGFSYITGESCGQNVQTSLSVNVGNATNPSTITVLAGPITNPGNGHTYYFVSPGSWRDVEAKAISLGGHLADIHDSAENEWITKQFTNWKGIARYPWIGLNDMQSEGTWMWSNGEPVTYTNWAPGEPNSGAGIYSQEDAVHLWGQNSRFTTGTWNDAQEQLTYEGIVEIGLDNVDNTNTVSEQVKCVFNNSNKEERCYSTDGQYSFSGVNTAGGVISGVKGSAITWKSTCEGDILPITRTDGNNDYINFSCTATNLPTLTLRSPNGGERWNQGIYQTILWDAPTNVSAVDLYLFPYRASCTNGSCPESLINLYPIARSVSADSQSYSWIVGRVLENSEGGNTVPEGNYTVKICQSGSTASSSCDSSNSYFTIISEPTP